MRACVVAPRARCALVVLAFARRLTSVTSTRPAVHVALHGPLCDGLRLLPSRCCRQALHIASQTSNALKYLHALGIGHLDVKPGNILLKFNASSGSSLQQAFDSLLNSDGNGQGLLASDKHALNHLDPGSFVVKLCDFGMAGLEREEDEAPIVGTIRFMPPEQLSLLGPPGTTAIPVADELVEEELEDYVATLLRNRRASRNAKAPPRGEIYLAPQHSRSVNSMHNKWVKPGTIDLAKLTRVRACVRACLRACVRVCVHSFVHVCRLLCV